MGSSDEHLLSQIIFYSLKSSQYVARFKNCLNDFEIEYDTDDRLENVFIGEDTSYFYKGMVCVETRNITNWFCRVHEDFIDYLDLKLIRVLREESLNDNYLRYKIIYTYKDNPHWEELDYKENTKIMEYVNGGFRKV
ncbi:MAG: hypothetical protein IJH63_10270 [Methanobrevibacter sp.]|nr:hypothetical protein [Methanosphaera sp.]MBR0371084.1 hypothetical protein [Methanobrevibacter sp.]